MSISSRPLEELDSDKIIEPAKNLSLPDNIADISLEPVEDSYDEVCIAVKEDETPETVLKAVIWGLAEEQNSLRALRQKKGKEGKDTSFISLKRGMLLKYMSETLLQKQSLSGVNTELDLKGPKFREIFKMFLEAISKSFDDANVPKEYKEIFFHILSKNLEGWEQKAERIIKTMSPKII